MLLTAWHILVVEAPDRQARRGVTMLEVRVTRGVAIVVVLFGTLAVPLHFEIAWAIIVAIEDLF